MRVEKLAEIIGSEFYTGVPDSQLKALCNYLMDRWGIDPQHHVIAANEGSAVALAAGYHLATGKVPVVYMQNSGEGNVVNPVASLLNEKVYAIPMIFVIGWRGEPGVHDEPQAAQSTRSMGRGGQVAFCGRGKSAQGRAQDELLLVLESAQKRAFALRGAKWIY